jgi:hypothetical protein
MHAPRDSHWALIKRILCYIRDTTQHGVHLLASSDALVTTYSNADWARCLDTRRSTSYYCIFLGNSLVSWSSKRQTTVSCCSAEVEYCGVVNATAECYWLRQLLHELHVVIDKATIMYCDNIWVVYLSQNLVHHRRTKHVEIDMKVELGELQVHHVLCSSLTA